jgi:hypothetical protein
LSPRKAIDYQCPVREIAYLSPQVSWLFLKAQATHISRLIHKERATRKNGQPAAARRIALKMGRRKNRPPLGIGIVSPWSLLYTSTQ